MPGTRSWSRTEDLPADVGAQLAGDGVRSAPDGGGLRPVRGPRAVHDSRDDGGPRPQGRDDSPEVRQFHQAIHDYRSQKGRVFPTWSEVLEVLRVVGHETSR